MLRIWLHGIHVGDMKLLEGGRWEYRFSEAYLDLPERPVLGRWFEDQDLPRLEYSASQGYLPAFFQNYLPENGSWLRELLARKAGVDPKKNGPLLRELGEDLPGAIIVREVDDLDESSDEPPHTDSTVQDNEALRFSLAGMQPKFSVTKEDSKYTLPVKGLGGRWIAKLPDPHHPRVPEHEGAMVTMAKKIGINAPEHECISWREIKNLPENLSFNENTAFIIRRYDRGQNGERIHQEDFAQVFDIQPHDKYREIGKSSLDTTFRGIGMVIAKVCGEDDFLEYIRRLVFMILTGNHDAHLKNWSLIYPDKRRARLAPAYDLLSTVMYIQEQKKLALRFFKRKEFADVTKGDFERLAAKAEVDEARTSSVVEETIHRFNEVWRQERPHLSLSESEGRLLEQHLSSLSLK